MVDQIIDPNPDGDGDPTGGDTRLTEGTFWEVLTTNTFDDSGNSSTKTVTIVYNNVTILDNAELSDAETVTSFQNNEGIYTRGISLGSGNALLTQWEQYAVSFESTSGGNSGKSWLVHSYPPKIVITWNGQEVWNQEYPASVVSNIFEVTPTGSEYTYYRGAELDPLGLGSGGSSGITYYDVNIGPSSPPEPGDIDVPDVVQGDFGLEVLNEDGNQIWGTNNRVISFVNAVITGTIPIPAGTPQTVIVDVDLTEFGWTLTNTSEIGVYVRQTYPVVRTSTGFRLTWFNTYGVNFTQPVDLPFEYYVMRF